MFKGGGRVETKSNSEWARSISGLNARMICWYSPDQERIEIICCCGNFPNVPLMGTKGCINYNPILAARQFGYPIKNPPTEESISPLITYQPNQNLEVLSKVAKAWNQVVKKGKELRVGSSATDKSYNQWLAERVQKIKLPFRSSAPVVEDAPIQPPMSLEEIEKLKEALSKAEKEKESLKRDLMGARQKCQETQRENAQNMKLFEEANKRIRVEEESRRKMKSCLDAANKELGMRRRERDEARADALHLKEALRETKIAERDAQKQLDDLRQQLKLVVAEYKNRIQNEQRLNENLTSDHHITLNEKEKDIQELKYQVGRLDEVIQTHQEERRAWAHNFMSRAFQVKQMFNEASFHL